MQLFLTALASSSDGIAESRLAAINSGCLKCHMRPNPKKAKSIVVSRSRTIAPGYGDLTFGGAELEE